MDGDDDEVTPASVFVKPCGCDWTVGDRTDETDPSKWICSECGSPV